MIKLLHGDCLEITKTFDSEYVDLTITSPPYDDLRNYEGTCKWDIEVCQYLITQLYRITKKGGTVVWVINDKTHRGSETGTSFRNALAFMDSGFNLHDTMIYKKDSCAFPEQTRYYPIFEYMFVFTKGKIKTFNPIKDRVNKWAGLRKLQGTEYDHRGPKRVRRNKNYTIEKYGVRHNIWEFPTGRFKSSKDGNIDHPAIFPEKLAADHIISWSNPGDLILDPMMGSGTVGKMAKELDRKFIGIEKVEKYFNIAKKRIGII